MDLSVRITIKTFWGTSVVPRIFLMKFNNQSKINQKSEDPIMPRTSTKTSKAKKTKSQNTEQIKAFKASQEVTNFYRFIHENGLRHETKVLLETVIGSLKKKRKTRTLQ